MARLPRFLERREGIHHICFEVDDIEAMLGQLKAHGVQLIDEEPYVGTGGKKIAFIHPKAAHGVLIELCQTVTEEPRPQLVDADVLWSNANRGSRGIPYPPIVASGRIKACSTASELRLGRRPPRTFGGRDSTYI